MTIDHWCRVVMNRATQGLIRTLGPSRLDVLEVSGTEWADFGFSSYRSLHWPQFDICKDVLAASFDLIIAEQVFEHLRYPLQAARNVRRMLNGGGTVLITTPFLIKIHPMLGDFWRWTPSGLAALLEDAGFVGITVGSWGNRSCVIGNFDEWPAFHPHEHSLADEPDVPLVVWATARRAN